MADKNIQMKERNSTNTGYDNLFPVTKAANVKTSSGQNVETEISNLKQSVSNGKAQLETAITDMGGTVSNTSQSSIPSFDDINDGIYSIPKGIEFGPTMDSPAMSYNTSNSTVAISANYAYYADSTTCGVMDLATNTVRYTGPSVYSPYYADGFDDHLIVGIGSDLRMLGPNMNVIWSVSGVRPHLWSMLTADADFVYTVHTLTSDVNRFVMTKINRTTGQIVLSLDISLAYRRSDCSLNLSSDGTKLILAFANTSGLYWEIFGLNLVRLSGYFSNVSAGSRSWGVDVQGDFVHFSYANNGIWSNVMRMAGTSATLIQNINISNNDSATPWSNSNAYHTAKGHIFISSWTLTSVLKWGTTNPQSAHLSQATPLVLGTYTSRANHRRYVSFSISPNRLRHGLTKV